MLNIDRLVFLACAALFVFWMGIEVGTHETKAYYHVGESK